MGLNIQRNLCIYAVNPVRHLPQAPTLMIPLKAATRQDLGNIKPLFAVFWKLDLLLKTFMLDKNTQSKRRMSLDD